MERDAEVIEVLRSVSQARVGSDDDKPRETAVCDELEAQLGRLSEQLTELMRPRAEPAEGDAPSPLAAGTLEVPTAGSKSDNGMGGS